MKRLRVTRTIAVIAAGIMMMTGCSKGNSTTISTSETASLAEELETELLKETSTEKNSKNQEKEPVTILIAAAASLKYSFDDELIPMFEEKYPYITVEATYDSSGKLQTQIEEGLRADVFLSAAKKQMEALADKDMIDKDSISELLENKIVLIVPEDSEGQVTSFEDIIHADMIAVGDPQSVPAGQYAQEALTSLGIWEQVESKASFGTNVTEVLNWVKEGSADAGIVYATDAAVTDQVKVIAEAPDGSLKEKVIYPAGIVSESVNKEAAWLFLKFLQSEEAMAVFESYGFSENQS